MKNLSIMTACTSVALLAGSALASNDDYVPTEWFHIGDGILAGGEFFDTGIEVTGEPGTSIVGFEVRFDYDEPTLDDSWASDAQVMVVSSQGNLWTVGGLDLLFFADDAWSFQGSGSDDPGHYGDSGEDIFLPWISDPQALGTFDVLFSNNWMNDANPNSYDADIRFFQQVPAPGALSLLGVAGLVGARRRRR